MCGFSQLVRQLGRRLREPCKQHVTVAHVAEDPGDPAQLVAQRRRPLRVDERPERPQIRAKPSCCHAGLMHALRVEVEPHDCVVADEADDGQRESALDDGSG